MLYLRFGFGLRNLYWHWNEHFRPRSYNPCLFMEMFTSLNFSFLKNKFRLLNLNDLLKEIQEEQIERTPIDRIHVRLLCETLD